MFMKTSLCVITKPVIFSWQIRGTDILRRDLSGLQIFCSLNIHFRAVRHRTQFNVVLNVEWRFWFYLFSFPAFGILFKLPFAWFWKQNKSHFCCTATNLFTGWLKKFSKILLTYCILLAYCILLTYCILSTYC